MQLISDLDKPDWKPLEAELSVTLCVDFMYMGRAGEIVLYKHSVTRRYLNIDRNTRRFYQFIDGRAVEVSRTDALAYIFS